MNDSIGSKVILSKDAWYCLDSMKQIGAALSWNMFLSINLGKFKKILGVGDKRVTFDYQGIKSDLSLDDSSLSQYQPYIVELACLGFAVKLCGTWETYMCKIVESSYKILPDAMTKFQQRYKRELRIPEKRRPAIKSYLNDRLGKGIVFLTEIFSSNLNQNYIPKLKFLFKLRHLAVHNSNIADEKLCKLAANPLINIEGQLRSGVQIPWDFKLCLQFQEQVTLLLLSVDQYVVSKLGLETLEKEAYWQMN